MNLYDELITILQDGKELGFTYDEIDEIIKALERAKKVEELLGLYQYYTDYNLFPSKVVEQIKQLEEEMK